MVICHCVLYGGCNWKSHAFVCATVCACVRACMSCNFLLFSSNLQYASCMPGRGRIDAKFIRQIKYPDTIIIGIKNKDIRCVQDYSIRVCNACAVYQYALCMHCVFSVYALGMHCARVRLFCK